MYKWGRIIIQIKNNPKYNKNTKIPRKFSQLQFTKFSHIRKMASDNERLCALLMFENISP